ncbi:MAG: peptidylprolyl isomerase [Acidobacteria bacterium]|nr:peptidylprolyl isomerase [Acidobacteriota bacterium]
MELGSTANRILEESALGDGIEWTVAMVSRMGSQVRVISGLVLLVMALTGCGSSSGNDRAPSFWNQLFFNYTDLSFGSGAVVADGDIVTISYVAWLHDDDENDDKGQQIDSNAGVEFIVSAGQVIQGFDQGVVGMKVGGERRLVVPAHLTTAGFEGYGNPPSGSDLVIEVKLLSIRTLTTDSAPYSVTDIRMGDGAEAKTGDTLIIDYGGWLYDASKSDGRGVQFGDAARLSFTLGSGEVIPGFDQGLVGMKEGGERRLILPPEFAYGENKVGIIPANSTLVFYVTLFTVQ